MRVFRPVQLLLLIMLGLAGCRVLPASPGDVADAQLTVLYTNDEHGWMEGMETGQGAANLIGLWKEKYNFTPDGPFLVLSGGDNWTGPAISTWFDGESMVEVMNQVGYRASAVGNHEFDFGLPVLEARLQEAQFPYLAANMRYKSNQQVPEDLGIKPFTIVEVGGIRIALIGLANKITPTVTNPVNVAEFDFIGYEEALREFVPQARAAGAEWVMVPGHLCMDELVDLARAVADLDIQLLGGGHCNELQARRIGDTAVIAGGYHLTSYAYAVFHYDPGTHSIRSINLGTEQNQGGSSDPPIAGIIAGWQKKTEAELNITIGYLDQEIARRSPEMGALITESWLWGYPTAQVAITNWGGMRDRIPAGPVRLADVVGVMPFNNVIVEVRLTGRQLKQVIRQAGTTPALGGVHREGLNWVMNESGQPLEDDETYTVLVNDFLYAGGDDLTLLGQFDPLGYNTAIDWRQPVIDWIEAQNSTPENPLDAAIRDLVQ